MIMRDAINITRSCSHPFPGAFIRLNEDNGIIRIWKLKKSNNLDLYNKISSGQGIIINQTLYLKFQDAIAESGNYEIISFSEEKLLQPFLTL